MQTFYKKMDLIEFSVANIQEIVTLVRKIEEDCTFSIDGESLTLRIYGRVFTSDTINWVGELGGDLVFWSSRDVEMYGYSTEPPSQSTNSPAHYASSLGRRKKAIVDFEAHTEDYAACIDEVDPWVSDYDSANCVISKSSHEEDVHYPVIDIDVPIRVVPSSTEGHSHLYIDQPMDASSMWNILEALVEAGVVEDGYYRASKDRGFTCVRLPWVKKGIS